VCERNVDAEEGDVRDHEALDAALGRDAAKQARSLPPLQRRHVEILISAACVLTVS
jgi:hypothetical protein